MVTYKHELICPHCNNNNKEYMSITFDKNKLKIEPDNPYSWTEEGYIFDCQNCGDMYEVKDIKINVECKINKL